MAKNKKPKKKYKPRPVILDTMDWCKKTLSPINAFSAASMKLRTESECAIDAIERGLGTSIEIDQLIDTANLCMAFKSQGLGIELASTANAGSDAIQKIRDRNNKWGKVQATDSEIIAIKGMLDLYNGQLDASLIKDLSEAAKIVNKKRHLQT